MKKIFGLSLEDWLHLGIILATGQHIVKGSNPRRGSSWSGESINTTRESSESFKAIKEWLSSVFPNPSRKIARRAIMAILLTVKVQPKIDSDQIGKIITLINNKLEPWERDMLMQTMVMVKSYSTQACLRILSVINDRLGSAKNIRMICQELFLIDQTKWRTLKNMSKAAKHTAEDFVQALTVSINSRANSLSKWSSMAGFRRQAGEQAWYRRDCKLISIMNRFVGAPLILLATLGIMRLLYWFIKNEHILAALILVILYIVLLFEVVRLQRVVKTQK